MLDTVSAAAARLRELATTPALPLYRSLNSSPHGLTEAEATARLHRDGENTLTVSDVAGLRTRARAAVGSPFVALLSGLWLVFALVADVRGMITVGVMIVLSIVLRFWQYTRADRAVRALRAQLSTTATVRRRADERHDALRREVPVEDLVPGDVVLLAPGDVVPADLRLVAASELLVDQSGLTGENLPVRKHATVTDSQLREPVEFTSLCFAGTSVVGGSGTAVVIATGSDTYFGAIARDTRDARRDSGFDRGVRAVGWTLVRFMLVMVPIVLVVNGFVTGSWAEAAMFAVAVAVGLTPEMLPVIVTTNLARGAVRLSENGVVVKRLNAIQDLGAMDVLCVDKTGTLTEDRVAYAHSVDFTGSPDGEAAEHAYLAVHFQTGPYNRLDEAIADQLADPDEDVLTEARFSKVDEIGFDHTRRRATVVVRGGDQHMLITKGDPDLILPRCTHAQCSGEVVELTGASRREVGDMVRTYAEHGMRVLAVAAREQPARLGGYTVADENDLVLVGFVGFVDPVRASAAAAVRELDGHGVTVKILTGDNDHVAAYVARQAGVRVRSVVLGREIDRLDDGQLRELVRTTTVFAKVTPAHKARIVAALREVGHAVGFIGDGVNDAIALRTADVGISVDHATDVAKGAADLLLTKRDLTVLAAGVVEGRRTLANTMKYVKITASSNFGNALSVVAASAFLPFLPILPVQLLVQNLLYDSAQLALPWDRVERAYLRSPRRWDAASLARFMLVFGPVSSLFDMAMFAVMWWPLRAGGNPSLFQTGWFVEGLLSQVIVVLVLRGVTGRPSKQVFLAAAAAIAVGLLLPVSPLAGPLRMDALPAGYFPWLAVILLAYAVSAPLVKRLYVRLTHGWL